MLAKRNALLTAKLQKNKQKKKLIVIPTTNLTLTLKSNTMKNSMQK